MVIQSASVQDRDDAVDVVKKQCESWKKAVKIFADGGYKGQLINTIKTEFKIKLEVIKRDELHTFKILPKQGLVERTFAWIDTNRRNPKNYERLNDTRVAMMHLSSIRIMLKHF
jgi:transposase